MTRIVKWNKYTTPAGSALPHPFLSGKIGCYMISMGAANSTIEIDLNVVDKAFKKLSDHGKRAFAHGIKQRLVDGIAGKTVAESYTIMRDTAQLLESGKWFAARDSIAARRMMYLANDMPTAKYTLEFTEENLAEMVELGVKPENAEKLKGWAARPKVAEATANRE